MIDNPQTDQAALRDRIAEVLWPLTDWDGDQLNAERAADAVMAVLPAVPVRAATHATVPDRAVRAEAFRDAANGAYLNVHSAAAEGVRRWLLALADFELRRMADEAQQQETGRG